MRRAHTGAAAAIIALGLTVRTAHADKMTDAEELFRRAKALMAEKKEKEACPLFEESEKLDPQMGTLLNLAICHEAIGRVASAWGEYRAVEQMAQVAGRQDRVDIAHKAAQKLEGRLPRLKITAPPENKVEGLTVKIDGETKGEALWGGVAIDPGPHTVETSAPGKKPNVTQVKVEKEGQIVPFTIPKLEDAPPPPPETPPPGEDPAVAAKKREAMEKQVSANRSRRTKGFVIGGVGVAVAAAGGVFGVLAVMKNSDASTACPAPCVNGSDQANASNSATDRALLFANVANVAIPIGALVTILGGYMILSAGPTTMPAASSPPPAKSTLLSRGFVSPSLGGATVGWTW